jgi:hypothetical protein
MLATALLAERQAYLDAHVRLVDATGKRLVVANGYARERTVVTGAGPVEVKAPRVEDCRKGERYRSAILPVYIAKSPKVTEVLPLLPTDLSTGDFAPALAQFLGSEAGLSPSTVQRLTEAWQAEHEEWCRRDLSGAQYVYWWVDGVYFNVRLEEDRLCCLVVVGVRPDGTKELVALADGYRESKESWAVLLRSLRDRGLPAPVPGCRRRCPWLLGCLERRLPLNQRAALLGPQDRRPARRFAEKASPASEEGRPGRLGRPHEGRGIGRCQSFCRRFLQLPQGDSEDLGRPRHPAP